VIDGLKLCHLAGGPNYIVGAGCEVPRGTPEENLFTMRDFAKIKSKE
jgi:uroporphyrinogen-III decarboxylase